MTNRTRGGNRSRDGNNRSRTRSPDSIARSRSRSRMRRLAEKEKFNIKIFHDYIYNNDIPGMERMLAEDPWLINKEEQDYGQVGHLPLMTAILENTEPIAFDYLLANPKLDIMAKTKRKSNILFIAITYLRPDIVKKVLDKEPRLFKVKSTATQVDISPGERNKNALGVVIERLNHNPSAKLREIKTILEEFEGNNPQTPSPRRSSTRSRSRGSTRRFHRLMGRRGGGRTYRRK